MEIITETRFIETFPAFRQESQSIVRDILTLGKFAVYPAKKILHREGEFCRSIGFLFSGEKRIYKVGETGREITLYELGPGEVCILNASSILANTPCPANAVSLTDVGELLLPAKEFCVLVDQFKEVRQFVFTLLNQRFSSVMELIEEIVFRKMDERILDYLVEKSENGVLQTTHQKIADDLGTAREVVSRLLKDLENKGIIARSKNLIRLTSL